MKASSCVNCGNTKEVTPIFKCDECGKVYCRACKPPHRCDNCKTANGIFDSNYTEIGEIWNKTHD